MTEVDTAIIGAGAAGLMAAIWAGRRDPKRRIVLLDGAKTIGAKILVAGGGRCNVTHFEVGEGAFAGSSRNAIRKVLRRFDVPETVAFFRDLGVELKREETGKLFPTTDRARTVLDALLGAARDAGVELRQPFRVQEVSRGRQGDEFLIRAEQGEFRALHLILATGGKSLPKTGSDGAGYEFARALGHSISERVFPALVPLIVAEDHFVRSFSGMTLPATLSVHSSTSKKLVEFTNSTLCTHFGLSGPSVLDISRYLIDAQTGDPASYLAVNWLPGEDAASLDRALVDQPRKTLLRVLRDRLPEQMVRALCVESRIDHAMPIGSLPREARHSFVRQVVQCRVPVIGDRGFGHAEVTAGGVPLSELHLNTMESRFTPRLHIIGEMCDVDGRIGGFNFQWAWACGYTAGVSVGRHQRS